MDLAEKREIGGNSRLRWVYFFPWGWVPMPIEFAEKEKERERMGNERKRKNIIGRKSNNNNKI